jgi:ADP-ribose pyrophosphatase YjhB (NUDIX family)
MYRNLLEGFHVKGLKISKKVEGVALVILESKGEIYNILTLKEKKNKVWKRAGQLAIPMETVEDKETPEEAVKRCLNEEIGIGQQDIGKIINNFKDK